ncbi:MAG TPA: nuclear transport factor 2 family protein [Thermoleophilaceae bacterium]
MRAVFEGLAAGDGTRLVEAMSDDFSWTIAGVATHWAGTWRGKQAVREELLAPLFAQFADRYVNTPLSFTAEEDRVVVESRGRVTTKAGARYDNHYCYVCRFDDDNRLASIVEYADTALMEAALHPPESRARTPIRTS